MVNGLFKIWFENGQLDVEGNHNVNEIETSYGTWIN